MTRRTGCDGKVAHERKADAVAHANDLWRRLKARVRAYKCPHCKKWHVGHPSTKRRRGPVAY